MLKNESLFFDRSELDLKPLVERVHDLDISVIEDLKKVRYGERWASVASSIVEAKS